MARAAAEGERVGLIARAEDLAGARADLARLAAGGLGVVVHALTEPAAPGSVESGVASALSLDDLPWGMLVGSGTADAIDLALVARRAAEDSGCPFFVVHERPPASRLEPPGVALTRELVEAFLGGPRSSRPAQPATSERAFAERAPFALASSMRGLEALSTRRHDVIERAPGKDCGLGLVGIGALGDALLADVERQRAAGHDVAAVRVVAWRPFPGPRLVKALHRALAITVLEAVDRPLAGSGPLALHLKASFADALTWAPDYPGIGRIPRIVSGAVAAGRELDATDLDAVVDNLLADERGKRSFVLDGPPGAGLRAAVR
jgi:pyruvate-ferredoxin/flavodoxin oxidoreductase